MVGHVKISGDWGGHMTVEWLDGSETRGADSGKTPITWVFGENSSRQREECSLWRKTEDKVSCEIMNRH